MDSLDLNDTITKTFELFWNLKVSSSKSLVGFSTLNYLIHASTNQETPLPKTTDKYIAKISRNLDSKSINLESLLLESHIQKFMDQQTEKSQPYFPLPIQIVSNNNIIEQQNPSNLNHKVEYINHEKTVLQIKIKKQSITETFYMRVLKYVEGRVLVQLWDDILPRINQIENHIKEKHTKLIYRLIPKFIATKVCQPLKGFINSPFCKPKDIQILSNRKFEWNISSFYKNPDFYEKRIIMIQKYHPERDSSVVRYFSELYNQELPRLKQENLRKAVIHSDFHQWNIVINEKNGNCQIGVIDFQISQYTYQVQQIAIYILYTIYLHPDVEFVEKTIVQVLRQFTSHNPMTLDELKLCFLTIPIRMCLSICNCYFAMSFKKQDSYLQVNEKKKWILLEILRNSFNNTSQSKDVKIFQRNEKVFESELFTRLKQASNLINQKKQE